MKKVLLLPILLIMFSSCDLNHDEEHIIGVISGEFIKDMKQKGLTPFVTGGGLKKNFNITVDFNCYKRTNISDARKLGVECVLEMLKKYNTNKKFREKTPYYPLRVKDISILLGFRDKDDRSVESGYIASMGISEGKVYFAIDDHKGKRLKIIHRESFEEALRIVEAEKASNKNSL